MNSVLERRKTLRNYQEENKNICINAFEEYDKVVLAMSPNAGKTLTTSRIIEEMLRDKKVKRVLFLAEGQSVLRKQNFEALEEDLKSSGLNIKVAIIESKNDLEEAENADVIVTLPQTISKVKFKNNIDLIVIDEAHNRYLTRNNSVGQVQNIIKINKLNRQLLLTGTPSCFIYANKKKEEYFIHNFTLLDLMDEQFKDGQKYVSDINCYVATWDIGRKDIYNDKGDIKNKIKISNSDIDKILDKALQEMLETHSVTDSSKVMIVCPSVYFANRVYSRMLSMKYRCILSESIDDSESENIEEFKNNKKINFLIVVNRGILGFNMPNLDALIDISGTRNINRIYQMFNRLSRIKEENYVKKFTKVSFDGELEMTRYSLIVALSLSGDNIKIFDGTGVNKLEFPLLVKLNSNSKKENKNKNKKLSKDSFGGIFSSNYFCNLNVIDVFYDTYYQKEKTYKVVARSTIDAIKEFYNRKIIVEKLMETIIENGGRLTPSHEMYNSCTYQYKVNEEFAKWLDEYYAPLRNYPSVRNISDVDETICEIKKESERIGRRLPTTHSLYFKMASYADPNSTCYRNDFAQWLDKNYPRIDSAKAKQGRVEETKRALTELGERFTKEHPLYKNMYYYYRTDSEFSKWLNSNFPLGATKEKIKEKEIREIKTEIEKINKRLGVDHTLYARMAKYSNSTHKMYDIHFTQWLNKKFPKVTKEDKIREVKAALATLGTRLGVSHPLYLRFKNYSTVNSPQYDKGFAQWVDENYPPVNSKDGTINKIREEIKRLDRRLYKGDKLYSSMNYYSTPKSMGYDKNFGMWLDKNYPSIGKKHVVHSNIKKIKEELKKVGERLPFGHPLYRKMYEYTYLKSASYDKEFTQWLNKNYPHISASDKNMQKSIDEVTIEIKKLGRRLTVKDSIYGKVNRCTRDKKFAEWYNTNYPKGESEDAIRAQVQEDINNIKNEIKKLGRRLLVGHPLYRKMVRYKSPENKNYSRELSEWINKNYPPYCNSSPKKLLDK